MNRIQFEYKPYLGQDPETVMKQHALSARPAHPIFSISEGDDFYYNPFFQNVTDFSEDFVKEVFLELLKRKSYYNLGNWIKSFIQTLFMQKLVKENDLVFSVLISLLPPDKKDKLLIIANIIEEKLHTSSYENNYPTSFQLIELDISMRFCQTKSHLIQSIIRDYKKLLTPETINQLVIIAINSYEPLEKFSYLDARLFLLKELTPDTLAYAANLFAEYGDKIWILNKIGFHQNAPLVVLEDLATDESPIVRKAVAKNINSSNKLLAILKDDKVKSVRTQAAKTLENKTK